MSTFTKSPLRVARRALAAGVKSLRPYAHPRSPKKYTQPQLFACLVLKTFLKTDYRGLAAMLADLADLRRVLALPCAPTGPPCTRPPAGCCTAAASVACSA